MDRPDDIPYGYCWCGCGEKTNVAPRSHTASGNVRGEPYRYIRGHHKRLRTIDFLEDPGTGCWLWQRSLDSKGYAQAPRFGPDRKNNARAHQRFYRELVGEVPAGYYLDHLCGVRHCVNPGHLEPVTHTENLRRGKGAKLNAEKAEEIRRQKGAKTANALAAEYGVGAAAIQCVWAGRTWKPEAAPARKWSGISVGSAHGLAVGRLLVGPIGA